MGKVKTVDISETIAASDLKFLCFLCVFLAFVQYIMLVSAMKFENRKLMMTIVESKVW